MWRITIFGNTILMFLFWGASATVIGPAYNRLVMYAEPGTSTALPTPTALAFSAQPFLIVLPLTWCALAVAIYRMVGEKPVEVRSEWLLSFTLATLVLGGAVLLTFLLAGVLPFILIGANIS